MKPVNWLHFLFGNHSHPSFVFNHWNMQRRNHVIQKINHHFLNCHSYCSPNLACNFSASSATPDTFATLNGLYTASAQTLEAAGTQTGFTATPGLPLPTTTLSGAVPATNTPIPQAPGPVSRCDAAQFLGDVTYPDGSVVARNSTFVKIWRIKNTGTCTWTPSYALVFTSGDAMSGPSAVALAGNVNPGEYIEIPVTFTAPSKDGNYRGYWKLRNTAGALFGIGTQADTAVWVDIKVTGPAYVAYEFAANYCNAEWANKNACTPMPRNRRMMQMAL